MKLSKLLYIPLTLLLACSVGCKDTPTTPEEPDPETPGEIDPDPDPIPEEKVDVWPSLSIASFLNEKGLNGTVPAITVYEDELVNASSEEDDLYFSIVIKDNKLNEYKVALTGASYVLNGLYYSKDDISISVAFSVDTEIKIYASVDIGDIGEQEDINQPQTIVKNLIAKDDFGKNTNLDGVSINKTPLIFHFSKGTGNNNPMSTKDSGGYIALYLDNLMKITCTTEILKIAFTTSKGSLTTDIGALESNTWRGAAKQIIFTAASSTFIQSMEITYVDPDSSLPVVEGVVTIAEVYEAASQINYMANESGWFLSNVSVTVEVEAVDAIDSTSTGNGLDVNARGKVLVVDSTGYIICSSGVSTNNPISFYQRVKQYLKAGTTQYVVSGKIAFFNGVVEIKVDKYQYNSALEIEKNYEGYVKHTYTKQSEFVDEVVNNIKTNKNGYGVNDVIKMTGLTYFNKYNSKGSYLFLDQEGKIVPIYSMLDKDRTLLEKGKVYDIIGLETMYRNRPSLRILKVIKNTELDPATLDFEEDIVEAPYFEQFYDLAQSDTDMAYIKSELTVFSADVYVSRYAEDKYTISKSYYYDKSYNEYTTGSTQVAAANHYALGVFNEELTYNQTLLDFLLENAKSEAECESLKVTLYFTLAYRDTVDGKNMWRVNIFEDLVMSLDYYKSHSEEIEFDTTKANCVYEDGNYQTWTSGNITVKNEKTELNDIARDPTYLKIVDGTKLTISYDKPIIGFTLNTATYSYVAGLGDLEIYTYRQFASYITVVLKEATTSIVINDFAVGANRNNAYLRVDSLVVNYIG